MTHYRQLSSALFILNAPKGIGQPIFIEPDDGDRSALIGSWAYEEDENFIYTFNANGTGSYTVYGETVDFTYTDNGSSVEIVFDDAPGTFDYTIDGNTLVLVDSTGTDNHSSTIICMERRRAQKQPLSDDGGCAVLYDSVFGIHLIISFMLYRMRIPFCLLVW